MKKTVYLIGAGPMAVDYAKVLKAMNINVVAVGRSDKSCENFEKETGFKCIRGGIDGWIEGLTSNIPEHVINAVSEENLGKATLLLMKKGVPNILVEKPGAATYEEIDVLLEAQKNSSSKVFIGYNRRFYSSVEAAKKMIAEDGGVQSFFFEFTEWGHVIKNKVCPQLVKEEWLWHNSTHIMDLAFYLAGFPEKLASFKNGSLDWHSRGAKYSGAGTTHDGALFSYMANWASPGRWVVEILTSQRRLIFKPLEKLQIQKIGSVAVEEVAIENKLDVEFKPGLYKQVESFLNDQVQHLVTLEQQRKNLNWYKQIELGN